MPDYEQYTIRKAISNLGFIDWIRADGSINFSQFSWPPDVFAMTSTILKESGAYLQVARPHLIDQDHPFFLSSWRKSIEKVAMVWCLATPDDKFPPDIVCEQLAEIATIIDKPVSYLSSPDLSNMPWLPFAKLLAFADQTCRGVGSVLGAADYSKSEGEPNQNHHHRKYPARSAVSTICMQKIMRSYTGSNSESYYDEPECAGDATLLTDEEHSKQFNPVTLCHRVDPAKAIVLPKMRTSQRGVTIRSLSLYLSLVNGSDVEPHWHGPSQLLVKNHLRPDGIDHDNDLNLTNKQIVNQAGPYNILLYPWPFQIRPSQFRPLPSKLLELGGRPTKRDRLFEFHPDTGNAIEIAQRIEKLLTKAKRVSDHVHGIVLPEMALCRSDFNRIFNENEFTELDFVACGIHEHSCDESLCLSRNYTVIRYRNALGGFAFTEQEKHHRWALDSGQVQMYGLGSSLQTNKLWWEGISLPRRGLNFFSLDSTVAYTVLVCEDLARPDPVADTIRAVGPNLVICLLMDGPQLASRWGARYATVLADDPGSSVITLSSLGMVQRSRVRSDIHKASRAVALWREPGQSPVEISVAPDAEAVLLSLHITGEKERTIDGRDDRGTATVLRLSAVHQLGLPTSRVETASD